MAKIGGSLNGFRAIKTLQKLVLPDTRIDEVEGEGLDEGRIFLHTARGWWFESEGCHSRSVGDAADVRYALSDLKPCDCNDCQGGTR